jgi:hypothetical protein
MATTYTWEIIGLKRRTVGDLSDAIVQVTWRRKGVDDSLNTGTVEGTYTENDVIGWITDIIDDDEIDWIKILIDRKIAELIDIPTEITSGFPWS